MCLLTAACGEVTTESAPTLTTLSDTNPAADVVEVQLVAGPAEVEYLPGKPADVWAYSDGARPDIAPTVPGPVLEAKLGDQIIVHFRNELPEETTIHWHGVRVPPMSDGSPSSQTPVPPGGTFDYRFKAVDAGTFWYHPHVHGDVQIERGLYGVVIVRGGVTPEVSADRAFVLDDVKIEATGKLSTTTEQLDMMLGRQGNALLVNGKRNPVLISSAGARERWRLVNSANGRFFNLNLSGQKFIVIGWDGGLLSQPYAADNLLIAPGERYEVIVTFDGRVGDSISLRTLHYDRGHNIPDPGPQTIMEVRLEDRVATAPPLPTVWGEAPVIPVDAATPVRPLVLDEKEEGLTEPQFFINAERFPNVTPTKGVEGQIEIWSIRNDAEMDHPFHLHGMFFRVLDLDGQAPAHDGWKDTINIPQKKTLRFAVRYGAPGTWMYHCHILEHAERGMMGMLELSPK